MRRGHVEQLHQRYAVRGQEAIRRSKQPPLRVKSACVRSPSNGASARRDKRTIFQRLPTSEAPGSQRLQTSSGNHPRPRSGLESRYTSACWRITVAQVGSHNFGVIKPSANMPARHLDGLGHLSVDGAIAAQSRRIPAMDASPRTKLAGVSSGSALGE